MPRKPGVSMLIAPKGGSMTPLIKSGAKVILNTSPDQFYEAGDIVAFIGMNGAIVVHRILWREMSPHGGKQYTLKGDNNIGADWNIHAERIIGKAQMIVYPSFHIDLATPASVFFSRCIAYVGRITTLHHRLSIIGHVAVIIFVSLTRLISGESVV